MNYDKCLKPIKTQCGFYTEGKRCEVTYVTSKGEPPYFCPKHQEEMDVLKTNAGIADAFCKGMKNETYEESKQALKKERVIK